MRDEYAEVMNNLNNYLSDIKDKGVLTKEDVLKEVENVFEE